MVPKSLTAPTDATGEATDELVAADVARAIVVAVVLELEVELELKLELEFGVTLVALVGLDELVVPLVKIVDAGKLSTAVA